MARRKGMALWLLAGLLSVVLAGRAAVAQAPSESVLRERDRAIQRAVQGQVDHALRRLTVVQPVTPRPVDVGRTSWLHEEPTASSPVITRLPAGTTVTIIGEIPGGTWLRVEHQGRSGYVWRVSLLTGETPASGAHLP